jgi:hypothetical protein
VWQGYHRCLIVYRHSSTMRTKWTCWWSTSGGNDKSSGRCRTQKVEFGALPPVSDCSVAMHKRGEAREGHQEALEVEDGCF